MKLSFSSLGCPAYTIRHTIETAQALGYDGVEIRTVESTNNLWELADFRPEGLPELRRIFEEAGVEIPVVGTSVSFAKAGQEHQAEKLKETRAFAEIASGLGCRYLRVFGGPIPDGQTREECLGRSVEGYRKAIALAGDLGVELLFETHDDYSRSEGLLPLLQALDGKAGVIWDILHPYRFGETMEQTYMALAPYIKHIHLKDSADYNEKGFDITLLGKGKVPVSTAVDLLKKGGYDGYLSFEWEKFWHPEIAEPEISLPHFIRAIRDYL